VTLLSSWRTALRIARREARRSKGRSALVAAMIAMPVLALTFAAVTYDMITLTGAEKADRTMGTADARIQWPSHREIMQMPDPDDGSAMFDAGSAPLPANQGGGPDESSWDRPGTADELVDALPAGSALLPVRRGTVEVKTPDGVGQPDAFMVDATSPLTRGYLSILDGRAPRTSTEVALSEQAMAWLDTGIGGTATVMDDEGSRTYTVVGQVEFPSLLDRVLLFAYDSDAEEAPQWFSLRDESWFVDTPDPVSWDQVLGLNELGMIVASRAVFIDPPPDDAVPLIREWQQSGFINTEELAVGVLVAGLALLEVVLLAGPAFAVSARRRQRQLALVAANGGTPAHVRRIVLADGVVLGLLGAALGIILGIGAAFAARPWVEELLLNERAGGYRVFPAALAAITGLALVTGLAAALVPAFVTARQNVVTSLAGRRGVTRSRKRWIAVGIVMIGLGGLVTVTGTLRYDASVMLAGLVLAELGLVFCTPALVGLVARLGRRLPLAPRIALRDSARNRAAAAPAISAVMAAVAGTVALGMILVSNDEHSRKTWQQQVPTGTVQMHIAYGAGVEPPIDAIERTIRSTLPVGELYWIGRVACPAGAAQDAYCGMQALPGDDGCPQLAKHERGDRLSIEESDAARANPLCDVSGIYGGGEVWVDEGAAVATLSGASGDDLAAAQAMLRRGGVVVRSPALLVDGKVTLAVTMPDADAPTTPAVTRPSRVTLVPQPPGHSVTLMTVPGYLLTTGIGPGPTIVSPGAVTAAGLDTDESALVASTTRMPTDAEQERAYAALSALDAYGWVQGPYTSQWDPILLVLTGAAVLITIGAAAVGTGLAAADGRADLSTLAAVGASPTVRRGLSISQSGVIAGLGSMLGALAGIGAAIAVIEAGNNAYPRLWPDPGPTQPILPWLTLLVVLVATPLIAIGGAGLFTRSRLPIERRL
jgi:putative ABC transport system permease protein